MYGGEGGSGILLIYLQLTIKIQLKTSLQALMANLDQLLTKKIKII